MPDPADGPSGPAAAAGPEAARQLNTATVLSILRDLGPLTHAELARRSGLARPTVAAIVRDLLRRQVAVESGRDPSAVSGRPGVLLDFNPRCATVAVARVLRHAVDVWIADSEGTELTRGRLTHPGSGEACLDRVAATIGRLCTEVGVPRASSVGVLLVGRVDPSTGVCTGMALGDSPIAVTTMAHRLSATVTVLNPTAAAALGVARAGQHSDALVIFLDRGIGAGIVSGGQVLFGATGGSGELGHCRLPGITHRCRCGRSGCLETVAAGWSIRERVAEIIGPRREVPRTLADLEQLGDEAVDEVLSQAAHTLGLATSWLVNTVNPRAVLLGGTRFAAGADRFLAAFRASVAENAVVANVTGLVVEFAGERADIEGGTHAALDRLQIR